MQKKTKKQKKKKLSADILKVKTLERRVAPEAKN